MKKLIAATLVSVLAVSGMFVTNVFAGDGGVNVFAADGDTDESFGTSGIIRTDFYGDRDYARGVTTQADGKIIVVGQTRALSSSNLDFAVARYTDTGQLDPTFDGDGKLSTEIDGSSDRAFDVAVQSDGKIVVAGSALTSSGFSLVLVRYNTDGALDNSFSGDGIATAVINGSAAYSRVAVALQSDGKILIAGSGDVTGNADVVVARFLSNGTLDETFNDDGIVTTDVGGDTTDITEDIALQADGRIVVGGSINNGGGLNSQFLIVRYTSSGSLDTSFGSDGIVQSAIGADNNIAKSVAIQSDGKIVAAGLSSNGVNNDVAIARYTTRGDLDTTFSNDGKDVRDIRSGVDEANDVVLQTDGKMVLSGSSANGSDDDFLVMRYKTDGQLDSTFSSDGVMLIDVAGVYDIAEAAAIQPNNKIVIVGHSNPGTGWDFTLWRVNATSSLSTLSSLTSSATFSETFSSSTLTYSVTVSNATKNILLTPVSGDRNATMTINGSVASNSSAVTAPLNVGSNVLSVKVTSQDGSSLTTYTVTVTRDVGTLKLKKTMSVKNALATVDRTVSRGSSTSVAISKRSQKFCMLSSGKIKGIKKGNCQVTVSLTPKPTKANPQPKTTRVKITIRVI